MVSSVVFGAWLAGCGAAVSPVGEPMEPVFESCAAVRARCGPAPMRFVRGSASGLAGLDGARARFAVRYLAETGTGIDGPRRVVVGGATVVNGSFEACVCLPLGGNNYPQLGAVVFAPGTRGERAEDARRAHFSQRFATLGDDDFTAEFSMSATPEPAVVARALASLVERTVRVELRAIEPMFQGRTLFGALVADGRPIPTDRALGMIANGDATLEWVMPGRASTNERAVLVVDANGDRRCSDGDRTTRVAIEGDTASASLLTAQWDASADAVRAACALVETPGR